MSEIKIHQGVSHPIDRLKMESPGSQDPFSDFKKSLHESVSNLSQQLSRADQTVQEMTLGQKDVHQAMIAMEEANLSLRLLIQVRNKMIAAYEEIMRMQF